MSPKAAWQRKWRAGPEVPGLLDSVELWSHPQRSLHEGDSSHRQVDFLRLSPKRFPETWPRESVSSVNLVLPARTRSAPSVLRALAHPQTSHRPLCLVGRVSLPASAAAPVTVPGLLCDCPGAPPGFTRCAQRRSQGWPASCWEGGLAVSLLPQPPFS